MELQKIKDLVFSKGTEGSIQVRWNEIEPLIEDNVDFPDKKKRFKFKLKSQLSEIGLDFNFVGNNVHFILRPDISPSPK